MSAQRVASGSARAHARALIDLDRFEEARTVLEQVVSDAPDDGDAWCLLALAQYGCEDVAAARRSAMSAVAIDPEEEWAHRLLSIAESALGHHNAAERAAREAVRLAPNSWRTYVQLAQALNPPGRRRWRLGRRRRFEEGTAAAAHAVKLEPNEPTTHVVAGNVAARHGDTTAAQQSYLRALALDPLDEGAQNGLAALKLRGRSPENLAAAATDYANVLSIDPRAMNSRRGVDHALRVFLAWLAYLIFLDAYVLGRISTNTNILMLRLIPVALLVVPAVYATRFVARLSPDLRTYLFRLPLVVGKLRLVVGLEVVAIGALLAAAVASTQDARVTLAGLSVAVGLLARFTLYVEHRQVLGRPPLLSFRTLVLIAVGLMALGVAAAAYPLLSLACFGGAVAAIVRIWRIRSSS